MKLAENGDYLAKEVIREFIGDCIAQKIPLPPALGNYVLDNLNRASSKVKRGVKPKKTFYRDLRIGMAVWRVMQCGFPRTRNRATRDAHPESLSACAIVADVLAKYFRVHLSEDAILKAANPWRHLE